MTVVPLTATTLTQLPADVETPEYARDDVRTGIVHIGVGGFHRAHEAQYIDRLLALDTQREWGIAGFGLLPGDRAMQQALDAQDHLYTLVTRAPGGESSARVIGSIHRYVYVPEDPEAALAVMTDPATRIVSLTITEGGYPIDEHTGAFTPPAAEDGEREERLWTAFELIVEALRRRRDAGVLPFTVMSCDNIQGNGDIARRSVIGQARLRDPELAEWIDVHGAFPNSMVDRITPATTDAGRSYVADTFGIEDRWPVVCESFTQWVLEDEFAAGRPELERVGVQLVEDVRPFEAMKLRLLNASHQAVGYLGLLSGYEYVHEALDDPVIAGFLLGYMTEASSTLPPLPGIDLARYRLELLERFANPAIADTLARLVTDGTDRISKFVVPVLRDLVETGGEIRHAALILAAWSQYVRRTVAAGGPAALADSRRDEIVAAVRSESPEGAELLDLSIFGDLRDDRRLADAYRQARRQLATLGPGIAMHSLSTRIN